MRTAIIGTGFSASIHAKILNRLGVEITAVVNPNVDAAQAFAAQYGAKYAETTTTAALNYGVDSVHICTPPISHVEIIRECIEAKVHLFSEKPLSIDPKNARELYVLAEEKNLIHAVNFNNRFYEAAKQAKQAIADNAFGSPYLIHGIYLQEFHALPDYYSWRYKPEIAGPMRAVTEIGSHWFDLARYWTGLEIEAVSANFGCFTPNRTRSEGMMYPSTEKTNLHVASEDAAAISLRFNNGAMGSVLLSEVSHGRSNQLRMEVSSGTNSLWWDSEMPYHLNQAKKFSGATTQSYSFGNGFLGTFHDCLSSFYDDVQAESRNDNPAYATFLDGAENALICDAAYESAHNSSKWIEIQHVST